ncbi:MAG: ParB N-terminal domain-containing protein [Anaerolineae bacterium]|nr:ParB N-terminal domain-containing protein [Anaerolineae bacterium]
MEQLLNIGAIVVDPALQPREQMDMAMVMEYAGEMQQAGSQFPPVTAFGTVEQCWLADGFHRIEAAKLSNIAVFKVQLLPGGRREAQLFSLGANATHGLRRTNVDKRRAVETALRDAEWAQWSDREIALRCAVSAPLVAQVRMELGLVREERKVERGGVVYTMQTGGIGKGDQDQEDERIAETDADEHWDGFDALQRIAQENERIEEGEDDAKAEDAGMGEDAEDVVATGDLREHEDEDAVEFGEKYVEQARVESDKAAGGSSGILVERGAPLPAPARPVPVLVPPAQAIPAPKLPAPEKPAPVVVLVARIRGDVADVTVGQEGTMPSIMRKADAERGVLVEVLSQVLADYFNTN